LNDPRPTILVTGIAGNLGSRLLPLLSSFRIIGIDLSPVPDRLDNPVHAIDVGRESSCIRLVKLLRETGAVAVVHLASVTDARSPRATNVEQIWQTNVAGTARLMEAISEVNRHSGSIRKFIYLSSAMVYGPESPSMADETAPFTSHSHNSVIYKIEAEADEVVSFRADSMGNCSTYLLRSQLFAGASVESSVIDAFRGRVFGDSNFAQRLRRKRKKLPLIFPMGASYTQKELQFVHVDDVARLVTWLLHQSLPQEKELLTLNVAGSGSPLSIKTCAGIAGARIQRRPSLWLCTKLLSRLWRRGLSAVPPNALPYMAGSYTVATQRLKELLGSSYAEVIQYSSEAALRDCFEETELSKATQAGSD